MPRKRHKPKDPQQIVRERMEREAEREMAETLAKQPDTQVNRDPRTGRLTSAVRLNCFNTLLQPDGPERAAVDWLEELVRTANGEKTPERLPDYIRSSCEGAPGQNITQEMVDADRTLAVVEQHMPPAFIRLLFELLRPDAALLTRWRAVVERHTGETDKMAQAAAVRMACAQLAWVRENVRRLDGRRLAA